MDTVNWILSWERFIRDETGEIYELTNDGWVRCSFFRMENVVCASNPNTVSFQAQVRTVEALRNQLPVIPRWLLRKVAPQES